MNMPDSMEGAMILSVIDFFLSIVIICGIGGVLYLFPYLNRLGEIDESKLHKH